MTLVLSRHVTKIPPAPSLIAAGCEFACPSSNRPPGASCATPLEFRCWTCNLKVIEGGMGPDQMAHTPPEPSATSSRSCCETDVVAICTPPAVHWATPALLSFCTYSL